MDKFVHLHLHTEYSLLDGATRLKALKDKCLELGMPAVAVTDHGNMYCAWKFYHEFKDSGVKPILGCEFYMCEDLHKRGGENREYHHLILLAKNNQGYKNLIQLNSIAFIDGFYYKPRIDWDTLKQHSEGLVCLSACIAGQLPRLLLSYRQQEAEQLLLQYKELFGEDYYIELQDHDIDEERMVMPMLIDLARKHNVKLVATNDVHYLNQEDAEVQDIMLCIQTNRKVNDTTRMRFHGDSFYVKSHDEMLSLFDYVPEAISNTLEVADKCNVTLDAGKLLPEYMTPDGSSQVDFFRSVVEQGLAKRYPDMTDTIRERVEYEFSVIVDMGFVDYFLIVWDFINYAKSNGIPVGPGRGSGAGSVIAYAMAITDVEPFKFDLLFERFLNPQRKTMPDFDIDFCMDRRGEVIDYVHNKYGEGKVSQIITFGSMASKNAIRDVCRAMDVPNSEANKIAKLVPDGFRYTIRHLLGKATYKKAEDTVLSQELIDLYEDPSTHKIIDYAMRLEGAPRQPGMHAAGVVICNELIGDHVPLQTNGGCVEQGGVVTTQFNMIEIEQAGLLKMDFLGLRTLTDIKKAIDYIQEGHSDTHVSFEQCTYDDHNVFKSICSGDTMCMFQLESGGMTRLMKDMQADTLEDVIAGISLYRPGPMQFIPKYIEGKFDKNSIKYSHPLMEPILSVTNGCIVYQEQVMQIVKSLAGFSTALADNVRYAMSKKKADMMTELGKLFVNGGVHKASGEKVLGCVNNGVAKEIADNIWQELFVFSAYAFNKSHATCYAYLTYQTAWLRTYYPVELLCAMLNNRINNIGDIKKYTTYAKQRGVQILPPCVNKSRENFSVEGDAIRFGLGALKGIGVGVVSHIVDERKAHGEFSSMYNLFERTSGMVNKRMVENFIKAGALDCFGRTRADMLQKYDIVLGRVIELAKKKDTGQISIFDLDGVVDNVDTYSDSPCVSEMPVKNMYIFEKEVLGLYMSGSPLDDYDKYNSKYHFDFSTEHLPKPAEDIEDEQYLIDLAQAPSIAGKRVIMGGILHEIRTVMGRNNNKMSFAVLEDNYGSIEVALYGGSYDKCAKLFVEDNFVIIRGRVQDNNDGGYKITVDQMVATDSEVHHTDSNAPQQSGSTKLALLMNVKDQHKYDKMLTVLEQFPGTIEVVIKLEGRYYTLSTRVRKCRAIVLELEAILGSEAVAFFESKK